MTILTRKYFRLLPAIYFMLLGAFFIVMEGLHKGLSLLEFCTYGFLFLPMLIPVRFVWTIVGIILSFVFGFFLLNGFSWLIQYLNGAYFKYPFDTFVIGFPFIIWTLFCAMSLCCIGLTSEDSVLLRVKKG